MGGSCPSFQILPQKNEELICDDEKPLLDGFIRNIEDKLQNVNMSSSYSGTETGLYTGFSDPVI